MKATGLRHAEQRTESDLLRNGTSSKEPRLLQEELQSLRYPGPTTIKAVLENFQPLSQGFRKPVLLRSINCSTGVKQGPRSNQCCQGSRTEPSLTATTARSRIPQFPQTLQEGGSTGFLHFCLPHPGSRANSPRSNSSLSQPAILRPPETFAEATPAPVPEPKKPRLQQVGRIPRVVSKRDRLHKPPPQSFSRPFARPPTASPEEQSSEFLIAAAEQKDSEIVQWPPLGIQTEIIPSDPWGNQDSAKPASAPVRPGNNFRSNDEFLAFPPRISSDVSGSSNSAILGFYDTVAALPRPGTLPDEDEVWNEYNEFLDTVGSSPTQPSNESKDPHEKSFRKARYTPSPLKITKEPSLSGFS